MTDSVKRSSLLRNGINFDRKEFYINRPGIKFYRPGLKFGFQYSTLEVAACMRSDLTALSSKTD
jgi:hypothetical protein